MVNQLLKDPDSQLTEITNPVSTQEIGLHKSSKDIIHSVRGNEVFNIFKTSFSIKPGAMSVFELLPDTAKELQDQLGEEFKILIIGKDGRSVSTSRKGVEFIPCIIQRGTSNKEGGFDFTDVSKVMMEGFEALPVKTIWSDSSENQS